MNTQEQLLTAANDLRYDDECGGQAIKAFRSHLKMIAEKVPEFEALGLTVECDIRPQHLGGAKVKLKNNGQELELYSIFYDRFSPMFGGGWVNDHWGYGLQEKIKIALAVARMLSPAA